MVRIVVKGFKEPLQLSNTTQFVTILQSMSLITYTFYSQNLVYTGLN